MCKKPVIPKGHITYDKQDRAYMLCPYCQSIIWLPGETNGNNSNPDLKTWNANNKGK